MKKKIIVGWNHITNGVRESSGSCALSLAIKDAVPNAKFVEVGGVDSNLTTLNINDVEYYASLSDNEIEFYKDFDNGNDVFPFEFELDFYENTPGE